MAKLNKAPTPIHTHEGGKAKRINSEQALRRSVMACMLWENEFYENGETIADRIVHLVGEVGVEKASEIAIEARTTGNLRHVPLLICAAMAKKYNGNLVGKTIEAVINRADELTEYVAIVNKVNSNKGVKQSLSAQSKKGLAKAFTKFDEYALAKYNRDGEIKLRDVLFLSHAKPKDGRQADLWKRLISGDLVTPDTWETNLSTGGGKKETFERLLKEGKLGYMALLRNLRNMVESGVDHKLVRKALLARKGAERVLPFRYVAASKYAPSFAKDIDQALQASVAEMEELPGTTAVLVDVSGSMNWAKVSERSELTRLDAACALASIIPAEHLRVFSFSNNVVEVSNVRGLSGMDAVSRSQPHSGTALGNAVRQINDTVKYDRLIVITDEQSRDRVPDPVANKAYMINVASNENGVGYGKWIHIDGFSESVLKFIQEVEKA